MHAFAQMFCAAILGAIFGSLFLVLELHGSTDTIRVCAILAFSLSRPVLWSSLTEPRLDPGR